MIHSIYKQQICTQQRDISFSLNIVNEPKTAASTSGKMTRNNLYSSEWLQI